jgi:hypothetical protein
MRVKALEDALQRMAEVQQQNHMELRRAFHMTDAHLWVLKSICEDLTAGEAVIVDDKAKPTINFQAYYTRFNERQIEAAEAAEASAEARLKAAEEKAEQEVQQDAEVFGGEQHVTHP